MFNDEERIEQVYVNVVDILREDPSLRRDVQRAVIRAIHEAIPEYKRYKEARLWVRALSGAFALVGFLWWVSQLLHAVFS